MKQRILWAILAATYAVLVGLGSFDIVFGADYAFEEINLTVPGYPDAIISLVDINDKGDLVAQAALSDGSYAAVIAIQAGRSGRMKQIALFRCANSVYTLPVGINNARQVTGNCDDGAFIRESNGSYMVLSGVTDPEVRSIGTERDVSGSFCVVDNPPINNEGCTDHAFYWHPVTGYHMADFPLDPVTYPLLYWQQLIGRTSSGMLVGRYAAFKSNNEVETNYWLMDNGQTSLPFPPPIDPNGSFNDLIKINDSGQAIFQAYDLVAPRQYVARVRLWDDDKVTTVALPTGYVLIDLGGINNAGQFVGVYTKPLLPSGVSYHNFIATPVQKVAKK